MPRLIEGITDDLFLQAGYYVWDEHTLELFRVKKAAALGKKVLTCTQAAAAKVAVGATGIKYKFKNNLEPRKTPLEFYLIFLGARTLGEYILQQPDGESVLGDFLDPENLYFDRDMSPPEDPRLMLWIHHNALPTIKFKNSILPVAAFGYIVVYGEKYEMKNATEEEVAAWRAGKLTSQPINFGGITKLGGEA